MRFSHSGLQHFINNKAVYRQSFSLVQMNQVSRIMGYRFAIKIGPTNGNNITVVRFTNALLRINKRNQ